MSYTLTEDEKSDSHGKPLLTEKQANRWLSSLQDKVKLHDLNLNHSYA